jgi:hypothetical protein
VYAGRLTGKASAPCEEVLEVRWFTQAELPREEFAFPSTAQALRDWE